MVLFKMYYILFYSQASISLMDDSGFTKPVTPTGQYFSEVLLYDSYAIFAWIKREREVLVDP